MNMRFSKLLHPDLINGKIIRTVLAFAFPMLISYLFQQFYNMVDIVVVGHFLGEDSLSAIGACTAVFDLLIGFGNGFGNGLGIVAARAYGEGNTDKLKKVVAGSLVITLCVTIFIMLAGYFFLKPLMILLDTPLEIIDEALSYIGLVAMFCGAIFLYNLFSGLLRAIGNSFMPLVFLIISSLANIFLDLLFISKFNMGVMGTALATVISQGASGILCLIYILKKTKILIPNRSSFKVGKSLYIDLIGQGLSMALMSSLVNSGTVVLQSSINKFGKLIIAGHISARKVFSFTNIPIFTLSLASATFVSQNLGAGKTDRVKKGVWTLFGLTTVWSIICMIVVPLISRFLISSISGSTNPEIVDYGSKYLNFMQPFYIVLGVLLVTRNSLQGLGSKILPLISSIIELLGKILFTAIIIPRLGTWGIILCEPLIWVAMTIELLIVYFNNPIYKKKDGKKWQTKNA